MWKHAEHTRKILVWTNFLSDAPAGKGGTTGSGTAPTISCQDELPPKGAATCNFFCSTCYTILSYKFSNLSLYEQQVLFGASNFGALADENHFEGNSAKSTCVLFSKKCGTWPEPDVLLNRSAIPVKKATMFLCILQAVIYFT